MPDQPDVPGLKARTETLLDGLAVLAAEPPAPAQIERLRAGLVRSERTLVVVGERNRGKSSLVNAMVGAPVLPADAIAATAVPIFVRHGSGPAQATLVTDGGIEFQEIGDLAAWATDARGGAGLVARIDVWSDSPLLADGVVLVDTPGVGGLDERHRERTMATLGQADAVLLVLDANQPVSDSEIAFLREAAGLTGTVLFALNKIDERAEADWADVLGDDQRLIEKCDPRYAGVRIHPVSARLALEAALVGGDLAADLFEESGVVVLREQVRDVLLRDGDLLRLASTTGFCAALIRQLRAESPAPGGSARDDREAVRGPDAAWRRAFHQDRDRLVKEIRRVARKQLEKRLQRVRDAADRRLGAEEVAERAAEELETFVALLGRRTEDGLRDLRAGVVAALRLEDLDDVVADFTAPRVGSLRAEPSSEDVWSVAKLTVSRIEMLGALAGVTHGQALKSLAANAAKAVGVTTAGVTALRGAGAAVASGGAAVAGGTAATGAAATGAAATGAAATGAATGAAATGAAATGAATSAAATGTAAAGTAATAEVAVTAGVAATAATVTVAVVVVAAAAVVYQTHREFVKLKTAAALDESTRRGDELVRRTTEDLLAVADRLEKLVDGRLRRRAESLAATEEERQAAVTRRRRLDEWDEQCGRLRADIAARLSG